jgi:hypothetical protein
MPAPHHQFPKDIGTSTQGHWMLISAKETGGDNDLETVALFMPGGVNGNIIIGSNHEYNEMKLTKVAVDAVSNIPVVGAAIGGAFQAAAGAAPMFGGAINPKVEVLYRDTALRDFQFSFIMAPTSQDEANNLKEIVRTLRQYSAPTLIGNSSDPRASYIGVVNQFNYGGGFLGTQGGGIFKTPNEFIIQFYYYDEKTGRQIENPNIPKIGRCVLTRVEIMYNPNAEWNTFHDANPLSAQLVLGFKEMRVIDSNNIANGY